MKGRWREERRGWWREWRRRGRIEGGGCGDQGVWEEGKRGGGAVGISVKYMPFGI